MITVETYDSLPEANAAMGRNSRYLGGGTLLMQQVNYGNLDFDRMVRCRDPDLINIQTEANGIRIGAAVTMAAIAESRQLDFLAPVAVRIGGPAIRNMATVGGNLFAASPFGDLTAALLALDGRVQFAGGGESSLEALLARRGAGGDIVRAVTVRRPGPGEFRFRKTSRVKPKGVSILSIAALLPKRADGFPAPGSHLQRWVRRRCGRNRRKPLWKAKCLTKTGWRRPRMWS